MRGGGGGGGVGAHKQFGPLEIANINHWTT
jgi:hypothetical protein